MLLLFSSTEEMQSLRLILKNKYPGGQDKHIIIKHGISPCPTFVKVPKPCKRQALYNTYLLSCGEIEQSSPER